MYKYISITICLIFGLLIYQKMNYSFGGVLKIQNGREWYIYSDKTHESINLDHLIVNRTNLELFYKKPIKIIHFASITAHQTLIDRGIVCGASIGTLEAIISCNKNGEIVDLKEIKDPGYIWIYINGSQL